jgi:hypothetical protein
MAPLDQAVFMAAIIREQLGQVAACSRPWFAQRPGFRRHRALGWPMFTRARASSLAPTLALVIFLSADATRINGSVALDL